ncbi:MAG: hypothetical protein J6125_01955, partial [Clostridia bacterium]|nr:hypothetical protein [Clostridia bacterium]
EAEAPPAGRRLLVSPERMRLARYTAALGPTTLFAVLSVQVVFAVRAESDPRAVLVACLLRVGLLGWTALRGYMTGERSILTDSVRYYTVKAELLRDFVDAQRREADSRPEADRPSA